MRLIKAEVKSFKGIRRAIIPISDTTVLVGANNAGKSSVLQAIHFAARALSKASEANKQTTISISDLEYLPTNSYRQLGHNTNWGNAWNMPGSEVIFTFVDNSGTERVAKAVLKSARNEGLSIDPTISPTLFPIFRYVDATFSAYIPGIAGIPLEEQKLTRRHIFRKAASGDSNVVLRNILLLIKQENKLNELIACIRGVYPGSNLTVSFDEKKDLYINAEFYSGEGHYRPLEFAGTGFLHVVQVFSYLVLFRPSILLIDEPESHLHPTLQTKLTRELRRRVSEAGSTALITTHSPFVARGLPLGSNVVWVKSGGITESNESELIKKMLGWGALDKPILLCTEDSNAGTLGELIRQVPELDNQVSVFPFNGVSTLGHGSVLAELKAKLGNSHTVIVHRDRDCLTDDEVKPWVESYEKHGIIPWVTDGSDTEAYFCDSSYLANLFNISISDATAVIDEAIYNNTEKFSSVFQNKRSEINKRYLKTGGSPSTDDLQNTLNYWEWIKGKDLLGAIRSVVREKSHGDEKLVGRATENFVVAPSLFRIVNSILV